VAGAQQYVTITIADGRKRVFVPVPFDPDTTWGTKPRHHIAGTVNGMGVRGVVEPVDGERAFVLGAAWRRECGIAAGDEVTVSIHPEGPQRGELAPDVAVALDAAPGAAAFFDSLAQFYRNAYLRWIDGTKRRPEVRAARISEVVDLLRAGQKERPNG
jgi:hypothetical protein